MESILININPNIFDNIKLEKESVPMKTGKAKSWLGEYNWVSLASNPNVTDSTNDAKEWCANNFGTSSSRWFEKDQKFFFKDEKDMSMFILRWS